MRILQVHNKYLYAGGEDVVVESERKLLGAHGHDVHLYEKNNKEIGEYSLFNKTSLLWKTAWSDTSYRQLTVLLQKMRPDICHVHNSLPLVTPSVYFACDALNIPVVQTLHNYRLLCVNAYLFRDGHVCEECIAKSTFHSLKYGCYRHSRIQSFAVAHMVESHRKRGTWEEMIDTYICPTGFARKKFEEGGLPAEKLFLKPNFLQDDPGFSRNNDAYIFFAGRLDETKGIEVLVDAVKRLPEVKFKIAGDGPLKEKIASFINIEYLGQLSKNHLIQKLKNASALVFPSIWFEVMPMVILEAFACGKPVIASRLGAMAELIEEGKNGILFDPGSATDLASKIAWTASHPGEMRTMGINARKMYEEKYSAESNYPILMEIYSQAIEHRRNRTGQ